MVTARTPEREAERLKALQRYEVLDSLPEQAYDDMALIASQICGTPIAVVSFVDSGRQWFKAKVGLDAAETSRDVAFCAHAILEPDAVLVVEDTADDERFARNPLVVGDPYIRFYAGAPLVTPEGHALGTLCVIDREPRRLDEGQIAALVALSRQVMAQLELRRVNAALARRSAQVERSRDELAGLVMALESQAVAVERDLRRAEAIQRSLLPHATPDLDDLCVEGLHRPGHGIGGDLYDVVPVGDRHLALVIADAAGHGVSAALTAVLFKHRLRTTDEASGEPLRPAEALRLVNASLRADLAAPGMFVTAAYGLLDRESLELVVASAGHPPLIWMRASGEDELLQQTGPALGITDDASYGERTIRLAPGDRLLLYTDGLLDPDRDAAANTAEVARAVRASARGGRRLEDVLSALAPATAPVDRDDVTLLLLDAAPGECRFTEAPDPGEPAVALGDESARVSRAATDEHAFLMLDGRVTWVQAFALLAAGADAIARRRSLVIDLGRCDYLDSTVLGTLHELVERADAADVPVRVQRATPTVRAAFEELCLKGVLGHCDAEPVPVPAETTPVELPAADPERQRRRLLRAHELLADLSEENRRQFGGLVDALRSEAPDDTGGPTAKNEPGDA